MYTEFSHAGLKGAILSTSAGGSRLSSLQLFKPQVHPVAFYFFSSSALSVHLSLKNPRPSRHSGITMTIRLGALVPLAMLPVLTNVVLCFGLSS